jgi:ArsR family transcriptional regulator
MLQTTFDFEKAASILKAIAHPVRLAILQELVQSPSRTVNELVDMAGIDQPLVSHHLAQMRLRGLLWARKQGKEVHYSLREMHLRDVLSCIGKCSCN